MISKRTGKLCTSNRRAVKRQRKRLRSGKIATLYGQFICDCQILDRSQTGARLRLGRHRKLPERVMVFDDEKAVLIPCVVIWQRGDQAGVFFPDGLQNAITCGRLHASLKGKYYAA